MKIIEEIKWFFRCINCEYHCIENFRESYDINGRIVPGNPAYPKINRNNCPKCNKKACKNCGNYLGMNVFCKKGVYAGSESVCTLWEIEE